MYDWQFNSTKTAVFSDIHANYDAFRACYEDALRKGADLFLFLGDYVSDMADPEKVLDLVYEIQATYPCVCLRGNRERYLLEHAKGKQQFFPGSKSGSLLYTYQHLRKQDLRFFESLPAFHRIRINGIPFEIAHAFKENDRFFFDGTDINTEQVFSQMEAPYLLAGHSHVQFIRSHNGKTILNPGSIGVPRDHGSLTQYALLEFTGNQIVPHLRQIPYDIRSTIHRQFESGLMEMAPHWAVSVLYDAITGRDYTISLLDRIEPSQVHNEEAWHRIALDMGMRFTEEEIVEYLEFLSPAMIY